MSKLNYSLVALVALTFAFIGGEFLPQNAHAATVTWDGANGTNWSAGGAGGNWSGAAIPTSADTVVFNELGEAGASGVMTNTVDAAYPEIAGVSTIQSLNYLINLDTTPEFYHRTEITAGRTLLATSKWDVDRSTGAGNSTIHLEMAGGAGSKFQVGNTGTTTANVELGNQNSTSVILTLDVDLTGLDNFEAYVNTFGVSNTSRPVNGTFQLAQNNYLRGNSFITGRATGNNSGLMETLLGQTNTFHFNNIDIAVGKSPATVEFNTGLVNPTLTIRGLTGGTSRANLSVGVNEISTGGGVNGTLDLSAGIVDALVDTFNIGSGPDGGTPTGSFTMSAGSFDANTLIAADSDTGNSATATLNIQGGTFSAGTAVLAANSSTNNSNATLNISGGDVTFGTLTLGDKTGSGNANGIINLSAGSLTAGSITKAAGGATLNFTGGRLTTDSINFDVLQQGGTLAVETGSTTITGNYTLQAPGTLEVLLSSTTGPALNVTGNVTLAGELDVQFITGLFGGDPVSSIEIISAAGITGEFSNAPDGAELQMNGLLFGINYTGSSVFLTNVFAPIPEPGSFSLLGLGLLFVMRKRRRAKRS